MNNSDGSVRDRFKHVGIFKWFSIAFVAICLSLADTPTHAQAALTLSRDYVAYDRVEVVWPNHRYRQQVWANIEATIAAVSPTEDRYSFSSRAAFVQSKPNVFLPLANPDGTTYSWLRNRQSGEVRSEFAETWLTAEANSLLSSLNPLVLVNGAADWETQLPIFNGRLKGFGRNPVAHFHVEKIDGKEEKYLLTYHIQGLAFRDVTIRSGEAEIFGFGVFDHQKGLSEGFGMRYTVRVVDANGQKAVVNGEKLAKRRDSDLLLSQLRDAEALLPARLLFSPGLDEDVWVLGREDEQAPPWIHNATQLVGLADNFALLAGEKQTNTVWLAAMGAMRAFDQIQMYAINGAAYAAQGINNVLPTGLYEKDSTAALWIQEMKGYDGVSGVIQQKSTELMGDASAQLFGSRFHGEVASEAVGIIVSTGLDSMNIVGGLRKVETGLGAAVATKFEQIVGSERASVGGAKIDGYLKTGYDKLQIDLQYLADDIYDIAVSRRSAVEAMQGAEKGWFDMIGLTNFFSSLITSKFGEDDVKSPSQIAKLPSTADYSNSVIPAEIQEYASAFNIRPLDYGPLPDWLNQQLYPDWRTLPLGKLILERLSQQAAGESNTQAPNAPAVPSLSSFLIPLNTINFSPAFWASFDGSQRLTEIMNNQDGFVVYINGVRFTDHAAYYSNFIPQGGTSLAGGMYWGTMRDAFNDVYAVGFGPLPTALPATGIATFSWVGGTTPVDILGRAGVVTNPGSLSINFGTGQFTYSGLAYAIAGTNYQFAQAVFSPGATASTSVSISGNSSCSSGTCTGIVHGNLLGPGGTGAAIGSAVMSNAGIGAHSVQVYAR